MWWQPDAHRRVACRTMAVEDQPAKTFSRPTKRVLVIFGATGDLAKRKLFPGFFHLFREGLMPEDFRIIGSGRSSPGSDDDFRQHVNEALQQYGRVELDEHWDD